MFIHYLNCKEKINLINEFNTREIILTEYKKVWQFIMLIFKEQSIYVLYDWYGKENKYLY